MSDNHISVGMNSDHISTGRNSDSHISVGINSDYIVYADSYGMNSYTLKIWYSKQTKIHFRIVLCGCFRNVECEFSSEDASVDDVKFVQSIRDKLFSDLLHSPTDALLDSTKMLFEAKNMKCVIGKHYGIAQSIMLIVVIYTIAFMMGIGVLYVLSSI